MSAHIRFSRLRSDLRPPVPQREPLPKQPKQPSKVFGPSPAEQALRALIESTPPTIAGPSEPEAGTEESAGRTYWRPNIPLLPEHKLPLPFETVEWEKDIVWDADTSNVVVDSNGIVTRRRNPYVCRVVMEKDGEEDEVEVQPAIPRAGTAASAPQSSSSIPNADYQRQAAGTASSSGPTRAVKPKWKRAVVSGSEILLEPLERENRQVKLHKIDFSAPPGVWDAADPRYKGFSAPLVLDRNDPGVIFRDELPESSVAVLANEISGGRADVSSSTSYDSLAGFLMQAMDPLGRDGEVASGVDVQTNATIVAPSVSFFADLGDLKHDDVAIRFKYFPPEFTNDELLALNRLPPPVGSLVKEGRKKLHDINVVNNSTPADGLLSARSGHVVLLEYVEEYPIVLGSTGMASRIVTYAKDREIASTLPATDGLIRVLPSTTPFPLIGGWLPDEQSVKIVSNNLYNAPLFQHQPKPSDFLMVFSILRRNDYPRIKRAYLREIPRLYVVGQCEPVRETLTPEKERQVFGHWIQLTILKLFLGAHEQSLEMHDITSMFQNQSKSVIKPKIQDLAMFDKHTQMWLLKPGAPDEAEIRAKLTPEDLCMCLRTRSEVARLRAIGLNTYFMHTKITKLEALRAIHRARMTKARESGQSIVNLPNTAQFDMLCRAAYALYDTLLITPWNLSSNYVSCHLRSSGVMNLCPENHLGDPSGRGEGYSFLLDNTGSARRHAGPRQEKKRLQNTTGDIRKKKIGELYEMLVDLGVSAEKIPKGRWERARLVLDIHTQMEGGDSRFVREDKRSGREKKHFAAEQASELRKAQVTALSNPVPPPLDTASDSEDEGETVDEDAVTAAQQAALRSTAVQSLDTNREDLALAEVEKAEKAKHAQAAAAAAASQEAANARRGDATLQSLGVLASTEELGNLERVVLHGAVPAALHSPPQTHEMNLEQQRAIPVSKAVLRRVTRQYDSEGNEVIIVDYIRKAEDIKSYRQRKGFEVALSESTFVAKLSAKDRKLREDLLERNRRLEEYHEQLVRGDFNDFIGKEYLFSSDGRKIWICTACHKPGHKAGSKNCVRYVITTDKLEAERLGLHLTDPTKITVTKEQAGLSNKIKVASETMNKGMAANSEKKQRKRDAAKDDYLAPKVSKQDRAVPLRHQRLRVAARLFSFNVEKAIHDTIHTFMSMNDSVTLTVLTKIRGVQRGVVWREFYSREDVLNAICTIVDDERVMLPPEHAFLKTANTLLTTIRKEFAEFDAIPGFVAAEMQLKQLAPPTAATQMNDGDDSIIESAGEANGDGNAAYGDSFEEDYFGGDDANTSAQFEASLYGDIEDGGDVSMMGEQVAVDGFGGDAGDDELLGEVAQAPPAPQPAPESDSEEEEILESGTVM